jgi:tryptophan-rich sensory protein
MAEEEMQMLDNVSEQKKKWLGLAVALIIPQLFGLIGALATARSVNTWYRSLRKPSFNPPGKIFGPVWTLLYLQMGAASWFAWRSRKDQPHVRQALGLYSLQLFLNLLWSVIFFGLRRIDLALGEIVVLWTLIAQTAYRFYRINPIAGALMFPYLLWTSFATILNAALWRLNNK